MKPEYKIIKTIMLFIIILLYLFIIGLFVFSKKTIFSTYEKRVTKKMPKFDFKSLMNNNYLKGIDEYLVDTIPYRDFFLDSSNYISGLKGMRNYGNNYMLDNSNAINDKNETITEMNKEIISKANEEMIVETVDKSATAKVEVATSSGTYKEYLDYCEYKNPIVDMTVKGVIILSDGKTIRAMTGPGKWPKSSSEFAVVVNKYSDFFKQYGIKVYTMIVPLAVAYYAPEKYKIYKENTLNAINYISSFFNEDIVQVDVYNTLLPHIKEDIYFRTDHHWTPLGAYYASEEFAKVAGVDFKSLDYYDKIDKGKFCGAEYNNTGVVELKKIGETFIYYEPNSIDYETYQATFSINSSQKAFKQSEFKRSNYFIENLTNGSLYLTFMGGDTNITHIKTANNTKRNLLILKDSNGNVVPSNLFYSFDNIYVVDYRYFCENFVDFVLDSNITDMLFVNSISACKENVGAKYYNDILSCGQK